MMSKEKPILFFDGVCHLCNGFIDALVQRDSQHQYLFAPLQGTTAETYLSSEERQHLQTVILYADGRKWHRSEAVLKILISLGGPYKLFVLAYVVPAFLRDGIYNWVASHRYAWFGVRDSCRLPTQEERSRLLP